MEHIDLDILKFLSKRDNNTKYNKFLTKNLCTKESYTILQDMVDFFDKHKDKQEIDKDFRLWFRLTKHPTWKAEQHEVYSTIITNILEREYPATEVFTKHLSTLGLSQKLLDLAKKVEDGKATIGDVTKEIASLAKEASETASDGVSPFFTGSITDVMTVRQTSGSLFWRLEDLNKSIGPIRKGDFVVVGKRPEVGGTSFLLSEMTYMLEQLPDGSKAIVFNNEEATDKVYIRTISTALGLTGMDIYNAPNKAEADYKLWLGNKEIRIANQNVSSNMEEILRVLGEDKYDIIGINVLLKVESVSNTSSAEDHDRLQQLGTAFRSIALSEGPVLAIVQADPSAQNVAYIPQDRIYKSKTAIQGEADALIMIGVEEQSTEDQRYIHVAKNKMPPHPCTVAGYKHLKSEVRFNPETGRFTSLNFKANSRYGHTNRS